MSKEKKHEMNGENCCVPQQYQSYYHFLVDIGAEIEHIDTGVFESVREQRSGGGGLALCLLQLSESSIIKLIIGIIQIVPINRNNIV